MTAFAKRPSRKLLLALLSMLLVASGLVYALPDSTPAAEAHDITNTYQKCVQSPFGELCETVTQTVGHAHCWNGSVVIIGSCPPVPDLPNPNLPCGGATPCPGVTTPTPDPAPDPTPTPAPAPPPCSFLSHRHSPTGACHWTLKPCNGSHIDHDATCPPKPTTEPDPNDGGDNDGGDNDGGDNDGGDNDGGDNDGGDNDGGDNDGGENPACARERSGCPKDPEPVTNEPPAGVTCPNGYEYGTGTNGWTPPSDAPAGKFWGSKRATPTWPVHECWQLRAGSCPNGQTLAHAVYSKTPNRLRVGYADLPARPTGTRWNQESANADYACYKLVEAEGFFKFVINGVVHYLKEGAKFVDGGVEYVVKNGKRAIEIATGYVLSAAEQAAKATADAAITALEATNKFLQQILCNYVGAQATTVVLFAGSNYAAKTATVATIAAAIGVPATLTAGGIALVVGLAIFNYCYFLSSSDDDSVPGPVSGLSLSAGDNRVGVSWTASATTAEAGFGYRVQWKESSGQTWAESEAADQFEDLEHGSDLATSYTISGLSGGSAYDVRVAAFNADGFSEWVSGTATPMVAVPEPASGLRLSPGDRQLAVSWSASATTPAAGFGYRVQWKKSSQTWAQAAAQTEDLEHGSDLATSHTITGLANGSAYDVRVAAFNANGVSTWIDATATPTAPKPKPKPSLTFDSVSCASSGSGWVISVSWSKTPETLKPDIWANEAKNRGHRGRQSAVAGTSTTFDVPNAGWYQVGMQAKIAGNKKVGDSEPVRCR